MANILFPYLRCYLDKICPANAAECAFTSYRIYR